MGNKCTFTGRVVFVGKTEALGKTEKKFYKRQIIVDDSEAGSKYANEVPFEYHGDKCKFLDQFKEGDEVEIDFFPNGRRWKNPKTNTDQWFCSLVIGYIKKAGAEDAPAAEAEAAPESVDDIDQMPF